MALLFMESFDGYGGTASHMTKWVVPGNMTNTSPPGRTGAWCLAPSVGVDLVRNITPATSTIILGFAFRWTGQAGWFQLSDAAGGGNRQCHWQSETNGKVSFYRGWGAVLLEQTASAVLTLNAWNAIEAKITIGTGTSGTWAIKVNGTTVLSGAGNTQGQATSAVGAFRIASSTGAGDLSGIDDLWVCDSSGSRLNDFLGDAKVACLTPQTGNGANTGLTCSTGTDHGALVDEFPANDDTDYTAGTAAGVKDTYAITDLATTGVVHAVQVTGRARKTDAGAKTLALVTRQGGTDYDGTTQTVASTSYSQYQDRWEVRPSDAAAWPVADVNGAEVGMKVVAITSAEVRLTNLYVEVLQGTAAPPAVERVDPYVWMPV